MSTARCWEAFPRVLELVLLRNGCHTAAVDEHLHAFVRPMFYQALWNLAESCKASFYSRLLPDASSWELELIPHLMSRLSTVIKTATLHFKNRHHKNGSDLEWIFFIIINILLALRVSLSWSPRQRACYTERSSGRANWLFIHVLNTMFCGVGRNHITAITFSSGSQYANRFCVYFSSLGKDPCCCLEID